MFDKLKGMISDTLDDLFGIKEKSMLGDVQLEIITDNSRINALSVTNRRVEAGFNISDTARKEPQIFNLTVMDNSPEREYNRQKLDEILNKAEPVTFDYAGRDSYDQIVLEHLEEIKNPKYKNCYIYYINLRQIDVGEVTAEDTKVSYSNAKLSGGNKVKTTASVKSPTAAEEKAVERGKSAAKNLFGGL